MHEGIVDIKEMWEVMDAVNVKNLLRRERGQGWEEIEGGGGGGTLVGKGKWLVCE